MNDRFLRALRRQPVDKTPIWLMRQAGRYLPEYRKIRAQVKDFMQLCKTPQLAAEVTLQPLKRFELDAAIIFSDILTIPEAMGLELQFVENEGPHFANPVRSVDAIKSLRIFDIRKKLNYVMEAIDLVQKQLKGQVPLIGFSGSPWTMATYMVEGGGSKTFSIIKRWLFRDPQGLGLLLNRLTQVVIDYLSAQISAGVQAVMIFDTWGGVLTPSDYMAFSLHYMAQIVTALKQKHPQIPTILFTKNGGQCLSVMADSGCDALGIDWTTNLSQARVLVGHKVALQGNMDPAVLYADPPRIEQEVRSILNAYGQGPGHIFNLGHGVQLDTPPENVAFLVDAVHRIGTPHNAHN